VCLHVRMRARECVPLPVLSGVSAFRAVRPAVLALFFKNLDEEKCVRSRQREGAHGL
jgi:hypothetical protein